MNKTPSDSSPKTPAADKRQSDSPTLAAAVERLALAIDNSSDTEEISVYSKVKCKAGVRDTAAVTINLTRDSSGVRCWAFCGDKDVSLARGPRASAAALLRTFTSRFRPVYRDYVSRGNVARDIHTQMFELAYPQEEVSPLRCISTSFDDLCDYTFTVSARKHRMKVTVSNRQGKLYFSRIPSRAPHALLSVSIPPQWSLEQMSDVLRMSFGFVREV